jgi:hypothetical protein
VPELAITSADVQARLDRLERQNRRLKASAAAAVLLAAAALAAAGAAWSRQGAGHLDAEAVSAKEFVLRDGAGVRYASLRITEWTAVDGDKAGEISRYPVFELYGGDGVARAALTTHPQGASLWLTGRGDGELPVSGRQFISLQAEGDHSTLMLGRSQSLKGDASAQAMLAVGREATNLLVYEVRGPDSAPQVTKRAALMIAKGRNSLTLWDDEGKQVFPKP